MGRLAHRGAPRVGAYRCRIRPRSRLLSRFFDRASGRAAELDGNQCPATWRFPRLSGTPRPGRDRARLPRPRAFGAARVRPFFAAPRPCRNDGARCASFSEAAAQRAEAVDDRGCRRLARQRGRGRNQAMGRQARYRDLDAPLWLRLAALRSARAEPGRSTARRGAGDHRQGRQTAACCRFCRPCAKRLPITSPRARSC